MVIAGGKSIIRASFCWTLRPRAARTLILPYNITASTDYPQDMANTYLHSRVQFADYPGITPDPNHEVRGMYVTGLTDANMFHLDAFEGSEYDRKTVKARLLSKVGDDKGQGNVEGEEVECEVYVFKHPNQLEDREWDFEEFRTQKMKNWTREDYGFEESDHFAPQDVKDDEKAAAV